MEYYNRKNETMEFNLCIALRFLQVNFHKIKRQNPIKNEKDKVYINIMEWLFSDEIREKFIHEIIEKYFNDYVFYERYKKDKLISGYYLYVIIGGKIGLSLLDSYENISKTDLTEQKILNVLSK